mgnify:FL=1
MSELLEQYKRQISEAEEKISSLKNEIKHYEEAKRKARPSVRGRISSIDYKTIETIMQYDLLIKAAKTRIAMQKALIANYKQAQKAAKK